MCMTETLGKKVVQFFREDEYTFGYLQLKLAEKVDLKCQQKNLIYKEQLTKMLMS